MPDAVPQIDKSQYAVAVFNASGIDGVAGDVVAPALENEGYQVPLVANPPDGDTDRQKSVVMYTKGNRKAAQNVAKDLGVTRAPPLDGYTDEQVGNADVVVLVGMDIANGRPLRVAVTPGRLSARGGRGRLGLREIVPIGTKGRRPRTWPSPRRGPPGTAGPALRRLALNGHVVYACRSCRDVVRVTSAPT